jgi:PAS domain S-box-containing protein
MDSGHRFFELADAAPVLIWRSGPDGARNYVNVRWLEFTGRSLAAETADSWTGAVHPDDRERLSAVFAAAFDRRREFSLDYRLLRHDGEFRWLVDSGRPFYTTSGEFSGFLGSAVDITDRKQAEVTAREALADARRALRQRDVLLAEVHHRVKNNLQVILSLLALKGRHVSDCKQALDSVSRRVQAIGIIQQELHEDEDVSEIGLLDFVRRLASPLAALHEAQGATIAIAGDNVPLELSSAGLAGLIVAELLSNAFAHGCVEGQGRVDFNVTRVGASARLSVRDSGPGFVLEDAASTGGIGLLLIQNFARQADIAIVAHPGPGARWDLIFGPGAIAEATT